MRALLLTGPGKLELRELPDPDVPPDHVLVRVHSCGICGSDVHGFDGSTGRRIPPLVMGHEAAGIVDVVGAGVTTFAKGDRVTFDSTVSCGRCDYCLAGRINLCADRRVLGVSCGEYRCDGAFAELVSVPAHILYTLPDELSFEHAAMTEAVSVAVHAVSRTPVVPGGTALVVGTGMIGSLVVQALRAAGWKRILATDVAADRLALAARVGATTTFRADQVDTAAATREATGGEGADAVFEAVGAKGCVGTAVAAAKKGGAVVLVGNLSPSVELPLQDVVTREITLLGSCASSGEYGRCIELLASGAIDVAPLISAVATLAEGPLWFTRLHAGEPGLMKVILNP